MLTPHASPAFALLAASSLMGMALPLTAQEPPPVPLDELLGTPPPEPELPPADALPTVPAVPGAPSAPAPAAAAAHSPSPNVAVNLIRLLVKKGQLTQDEADVLIQQAEQEAAEARGQAQSQAQAAATAAASPPPAADELRVTYIPQTVRNGIRDEIKQDLMAEAREQNWGKSEVPEWTSRIRPFADFRGRYEGIFFADGNDNTGSFPNFNAINTGSPFDTAGTQFSPQYNVDQDRDRARIRARFGADLLLGDGFTGGLRVATGESNSPVSPNQSLGASGGNFSKYAIWLDRAFLAWSPEVGEGNEFSVLLGRFDNPFFSTEVMWDDDLGFDGLGFKGRVRLNDQLSTFFAGGLFPVYNTDFNFASNRPDKFESQDKWLYGAQLGLDWKLRDDLRAKFGVAYYQFSNIEGELSSPFTPLSPNDAGDTDGTRPSFAQRGNTYRALRNIVPTAANGNGTTMQYQYYGLATPFKVLTATGRLDYDPSDALRVSLVGEFSRNLAFDADDIGAVAVNNRSGTGIGRFDGGDSAWNLTLQLGRPAMAKFGDWTTAIGYRYVESDAVVDGFTDSDFGGGATNVKGFILGGAMAVSPNVRVGLKWMSSDEVSGPPLGMDTLQFDISARF